MLNSTFSAATAFCFQPLLNYYPRKLNRTATAPSCVTRLRSMRRSVQSVQRQTSAGEHKQAIVGIRILLNLQVLGQLHAQSRLDRENINNCNNCNTSTALALNKIIAIRMTIVDWYAYPCRPMNLNPHPIAPERQPDFRDDHLNH